MTIGTATIFKIRPRPRAVRYWRSKANNDSGIGQPDGVDDSNNFGDTYSSIAYTLTDPDGIAPFATVDFYYDTDADMKSKRYRY